MLALISLYVQEEGGPDARIADYFDVIAGTSTGALIATMLTTPDATTGRPLFAAKDITEFHLKKRPNIFVPPKLGFVWMHVYQLQSTCVEVD